MNKNEDRLKSFSIKFLPPSNGSTAFSKSSPLWQLNNREARIKNKGIFLNIPKVTSLGSKFVLL